MLIALNLRTNLNLFFDFILRCEQRSCDFMIEFPHCKLPPCHGHRPYRRANIIFSICHLHVTIWLESHVTYECLSPSRPNVRIFEIHSSPMITCVDLELVFLTNCVEGFPSNRGNKFFRGVLNYSTWYDNLVVSVW